MADALTPPQGLIAITNRRTVYGFPMGIPAGGAGTTVIIKPPPSYVAGGGQKITLIGDYAPAVFPPREKHSSYLKNAGGGMAVKQITPTRAAMAAGISAHVIPDVDMPKARGGGGTGLASVTVVTIP